MPNPQHEDVPEYRIVDSKGAFIEPQLVAAGSVIRYNGPPGPHLQPLNHAAYQRMEAWYEEEYDEVDDKGKKTGEKVYPHRKYRIAPPSENPSTLYGVEVIAEAQPQENIQSLAEILASKKPTSVRPPPASYFPTADTAAPAQLKGGAEVVSEPKPAPKPRAID